MQFLIDRYDEILALLGTVYALICGVVALTPTTSDDRALARFQQRISLLQPRNVPGVLKLPGARPGRTEDAFPPMLVVLLCIAPLLGACHKHELRRQVIAAESLDAAVASDASAFEAHLRRRVTERIQAECPAAPDWAECGVRVAHEEADRVAEWEATHNLLVASRDTYVAAIRGQQTDPPQPIGRLLDEAVNIAGRLVDVARSFGADVDLSKLIQIARDR